MMKNNSNSIYEKLPNGVIYSPFNIKIDSMERLLLINFEKDPDEVYVGFEPQVFNDRINGKGIRVIGWRSDGYVDVYQQPELSTDSIDFDIVAKGLADLVQRPMENAKYEVSSMGVDVYFAFDDKNGRRVEVILKENCGKTTKPFNILAPMGSAAVKPPALPLYMLYEFYFVRRDNTEIKIMIDGVSHKPDGFPFPMDGSKIYFMRYSADPFLINLNPAYNGPLYPLQTNGDCEVKSGNIRYALRDNGGHYEISRMTAGNDKHSVNIDFMPPIPDIECLKDGVDLQGSFTLECVETTGTVSGKYRITRQGDEIKTTIEPLDGWKPSKNRWLVRFIFTVAKIFKTWPKTYVWTGSIKLDNNSPIMHSSWERKA